MEQVGFGDGKIKIERADRAGTRGYESQSSCSRDSGNRGSGSRGSGSRGSGNKDSGSRGSGSRGSGSRGRGSRAVGAGAMAMLKNPSTQAFPLYLVHLMVNLIMDHTDGGPY